MDKQKLKKTTVKSVKGFGQTIPIIVGVVLVVGVIKSFVTKDLVLQVFTGNTIIDSSIGAIVGSILAGNPITSYILGGELLSHGVSLFAVTAFLVAWVTVGVVQFPAEASILGKKFAIYRNLCSFLLALVVAIVTVLIVMVLI